MKKRTVIALILAVALILAGAVMLALSASLAEEDGWMEPLTQRQISVTEEFDAVVIETGDCHVSFVPYEGAAEPYVVLLEKEKISHNAQVQDGVLKIEMEDNRKWTDYIGISWKSMEMTVYLPEKQYESLKITTSTGDIKIPEVLSAKEMVLRADTGEIYCDGTADALLNCETDTGDIQLKNIRATEIYLKTDTGEVEGQNINCGLLACESDTGDVVFEKLAAAEYLQVFTNTGNVKIQDSDAGKINIETDTGNISVPASWKEKDHRIESDTGKIRFK